MCVVFMPKKSLGVGTLIAQRVPNTLVWIRFQRCPDTLVWMRSFVPICKGPQRVCPQNQNSHCVICVLCTLKTVSLQSHDTQSRRRPVPMEQIGRIGQPGVLLRHTKAGQSLPFSLSLSLSHTHTHTLTHTH